MLSIWSDWLKEAETFTKRLNAVIEANCSKALTEGADYIRIPHSVLGSWTHSMCTKDKCWKNKNQPPHLTWFTVNVLAKCQFLLTPWRSLPDGKKTDVKQVHLPLFTFFSKDDSIL